MIKSASFIGSGKIVHSLIPALIEKNISVESVYSLNKTELNFLNSNYKVDAVNDLSKLFTSDIIFIAVPDSLISEIAVELSTLTKNFSNTIFIHLSGSKTIADLSSLAEKKYKVAGFHPMQTFPSYEKVNLQNIYSAIEATDLEVFDNLKDLAQKLEMNPFEIKSEEKTAYHLMGVFVSNFMTANFFNADQITKQFGNIPKSQELLNIIAKQTLENILKNGAVNSLSGPIERGDVETVKLHLEELKKNKTALDHYTATSLTLLKIAFEKGSINQEKFNEISILLKNCK